MDDVEAMERSIELARVEGIAGAPSAPEVVPGFLEDRVRALYAELDWPPAE